MSFAFLNLKIDTLRCKKTNSFEFVDQECLVTNEMLASLIFLARSQANGMLRFVSFHIRRRTSVS